jgi:hypothetical protein
VCPPLDFPKFLIFYNFFPLFFNIPRKLCKSKFDFDFDFDLVVVDLAPKRLPDETESELDARNVVGKISMSPSIICHHNLK